MYYRVVLLSRNDCTVKPALSDHPTVQEKVVVIDRWSLKQGSLNSGQFFEALSQWGTSWNVRVRSA